MITPYYFLPLLLILLQWSPAAASFGWGGSPATETPNSTTSTLPPDTGGTSNTSTSGTAETTACHPFSLQPPSGKHWIIAHRGASAHLPEHTLPAYRLAMELGAHWIEPDLIATADGQLISMHTLDLNITTNVAKVYGEDRQWHSPFANRTSWWAFNFTLEEISRNLTVVQRLPEARTTLYDGLFGIPTLTQIVQLVNDWNRNDFKLISTDATVSKQWTGIYAELKNADWLLHDTGMDLVELLYQNFDSAHRDWNDLWKTWGHHACQYHNGIVPPFVLQSFDAAYLKNFSGRWKSHDFSQKVGEPPYVLLVSKPECWQEDFWFTVGELDRGFLSGLGPDKACLLEDSLTTEVGEGMAVLEKAKQYRLQVHPWTERPETSYLSTPFVTLEEELLYLFCDLNVPGVFTESVAAAVKVAAMGCDTDADDELPIILPSNTSTNSEPAIPPIIPTTTDDSPLVDDTTSSNSTTNETTTFVSTPSSASSAPFCPTEGSKTNLYFGLAAFIVGAFAAVVVLLLMAGRNPLRPGERSYRIRRRRNDRTQVYNQASPREEEEDDYPSNSNNTNDNVELT